MPKRPIPNQHVVRRPDGWAVLGAGNSRDTVVKSTQIEAIERARQIAQRLETQVIIHDRRNRIRDADSYGNDPNPPKDKKH
ncbi:MAG: hypothetical protein DIJKHBIC_02310 [Thermoanaerobaculia bacterium]|nr:hypothetical protein [Thermoanaerobaculia bacterium]